jgi:2C-methyl-D-erythritol 2,4-cyclodiphosphate synthase
VLCCVGVKLRGDPLASPVPLSRTIDTTQQNLLNFSIMKSIPNLSVQQLLQAANLKEKIVALEKELSQLLGSATKPAVVKAPKKRGMSVAGRARVAAAQRARWAKFKAAKK